MECLNGCFCSVCSPTGGLSCCSFNMDSGRVTINSPFPQPSAIFLLQQMVPHLHLNLFSIGLNLWLLEDGKGGLYPLGYDCAGNMKHLPFLVNQLSSYDGSLCCCCPYSIFHLLMLWLLLPARGSTCSLLLSSTLSVFFHWSGEAMPVECSHYSTPSPLKVRQWYCIDAVYPVEINNHV